MPAGIGIFKGIPDPNEKLSLYASGGMVLRFLSNERWESMSTAETLTLARTLQSYPGPAVNAGLVPPATFLFKTPKGLTGLLQITGNTDNLRGVKIRYKLVQNVVSGLTNAFQPPENPGMPARLANIPPQTGGEVQPPGTAAVAASMPVTSRGVLLAVPVLGLFLILILVLIVTVLLLAIKKWKSGPVKAIALGCGVLVLGAFLVLCLLLLMFLGFRHVVVNSSSAEMAAARTQAQIQMNEARARAQRQMADSRAHAQAQMAETRNRAERLQAQAKANANLTLGLMIEQVLPIDTAVNVGSAQVQAVPDYLTKLGRGNEKDVAVCAWLEQAHMDFAFLGDDGIYGMTRDLKILKRDEWDSFSSQNFVESLHDLGRNVATRFGNAKTLNDETKYTYAFKTSAGQFGLLQITGFTDNPRGVQFRYKLVQNGSAALNSISIPFRGYPVNRGWAELAQLPNTDSPEGIAARFTLAMLGGDPAAAMNRYGIGLMTLPPEAVNVSLSDADREWSRQNRPPKVIIYRDELAAVFVPQNDGSGLATVLLGKRLDEWRVCLTLDLPKARTLAEAEQTFRERAADLDDSFAKMPDRQPSLVAEATRELTTNLIQIAGAMVNSVTQMVSQVPDMSVALQNASQQMSAQLQNSMPVATNATEHPGQDFKVRIDATAGITSFPARDEVLAAIAQDAARAGDIEDTRDALKKITAFPTRDVAIYASARLLVAAGRRADALELAKLVTAFPTRDALISELAK